MLLLQRLEHCLAAAAAAADAAGRQHHLLHHHSPTVTGPRGDHHLLSDVCLRLRLLQLLLLLLQQVLLVLLRCGPLQLVLLGRVVVSSAGPAASKRMCNSPHYYVYCLPACLTCSCSIHRYLNGVCTTPQWAFTKAMMLFKLCSRTRI